MTQLEKKINEILNTHLKPGTDKGSTQAVIDTKDIKEAAKSITIFIEKAITDCPELDLPNGAKGAIWKDDLGKNLKY